MASSASIWSYPGRPRNHLRMPLIGKGMPSSLPHKVMSLSIKASLVTSLIARLLVLKKMFQDYPASLLPAGIMKRRTPKYLKVFK